MLTAVYSFSEALGSSKSYQVLESQVNKNNTEVDGLTSLVVLLSEPMHYSCLLHLAQALFPGWLPVL